MPQTSTKTDLKTLLREYGGGHHGNDEWISVRGVDELYEVVRRYVLEAARV